MNLQIDYIGGQCPVQAEGSIDGVPFYFRARHEHWSMSIGDDPVGIGFGGKEGWRKCEPWGNEKYSAGYMPAEDAQRIIEACAAEYIESRGK